MPQNPFADGLHVEIGGSSEGLSGAISSAKSNLGDFKTAALGAGAVVGGGLAAGLKASVDAASSYEDALIEVEKVTDPETAAAMGESIKDMAEEMPIAQEELAGITEQAARLGIEGQENLEDYTKTAAEMATATDLTADEAADSFARIGTLMDIPIEQSGNLGSAMNELANTMGTSSSEITDVMTRAGGAMNQLGVAEEEALALSGAMNEVSPSSRLAAGGMKRMSEAMMDPSNVGAFSEALGVTEEEFRQMREEDPSETLLSVADAANNSKDAADVLKGELGEAGSEFVTLGQNTDSAREATERAGEAWEENTSLQEEAESAASTFSSQLQMVKNRFQNIGISIGERALPHLKSFLDAVVDGVEYLSALNDRLDGALVAGGVGAALSVLAAGAWAAAPALWAMLAPVMVAAAPFIAVGAAIGGLYYAVQNNILGLGDIFESVMGAVTDAIAIAKGVIDDFVTFVKLLLSGDFAEAFDFAKDAVKSGIEGAATWLTESAVPTVKSAIGTLIEGAISAFESIVDKSKQVVEDAIGAIVEWVKDLGKEDVKAAFNALGSGIRAVLKLYMKVGGKLWELVTGFIGDLVEYFKNDAKDDAKAALVVLGDALVAAFKATVEALTPPDGLIVQLIGDIATYLEEDAVDDITAAIGAVIDVLWAAWEGFYEGLIGGSFIPELFEAVAEYIANAGKELVETAIGAVVDAAETVFENWKNAIIGAGGIVKSLFESVAGYISGTAAGDLASAARSAAEDAANALIDKFNDVLPSSFDIPSVTIGGGSASIPSKTIPGTDRTIGGGSLNVPSETVGGQSINIPQLQSGGRILDDGLAWLHAGEDVIAEADRGEGGAGDTYDVNVTIQGDADRRDVKRGVSDALRSINAKR